MKEPSNLDCLANAIEQQMAGIHAAAGDVKRPGVRVNIRPPRAELGIGSESGERKSDQPRYSTRFATP